MSITASEMTPADIRACCGNDNNGGFGGMWGDWIILFLLFGMFGYGGFGGGFGFGGFGGGGLNGVLTRADINEGFALNNITGGIQAIQQGICDSTYALTNAINGGFHGVERGMWDVSRQISDCCCQTQRAIDGVNYNMAKGFCDLGNVIQNTTRDVIDNANANSRAILDFLTQDKIATLTAENQNLKFAASQSNQNAVLMAAMDANKAEILRRTGAECPTPAYLVNAPTPVSFPVNACGQVQFGGYNGGCGWNNCGAA
jgi:hypothetical protein